ncbi:MAG TPA: sigma-70 family RNA polymerase sigma factor [Gemmatimonadales bacterium]|nr:sigma-70 family RNA polymerase sigma factor [Gemmatimonadales bacterium]
MGNATAGAHTPETFEQLLTPLLDKAFGLALNLLGDRAEAEDAVQEAALLAFKNFKSFEPGTNFKAWFFRILVNWCFGRHRQRKRRPETVEYEDVPPLYLYEQTRAAGMQRAGADPVGEVIDRLDATQVRSAIEALPEEFRAVAALYFLEDSTYQEIASVLDVPVGTVRSRLHRARRLLQRRLWSLAVDAGLVSAPGGEVA